MKRAQQCTHCHTPIRQGFPRLRYLYCTIPCMQEHGRLMGRRGQAKAVQA